ncbi:hypothetical protein BGZ54_004517, partial [Gamsiella multidivaricata]
EREVDAFNHDEQEEEEKDDDDRGRKDSDHLRCHTVLLQHLYTGDPIITTNLKTLKMKGLITDRSRTEIDQGIPTIESLVLSNVGRREPRKGPRDLKDSTSVIDLSMMREHVQSIR